jgi:hypothetical protein
MARKDRPGAQAPGRGAEIMAYRNRARRPDERPARTGRANRKRQAIQADARA